MNGGGAMWVVVVGRAPRGTCSWRRAGADASRTDPSAAVPRTWAAAATPGVRGRRGREEPEPVVDAGGVGRRPAGQIRRDVAQNTVYRRHLQTTSPPQSHLGRAASPPLTAENGLARCVCYYLCSGHRRRVQSLSHRYATSTQHRRTHDAGIHRTSIALRDKNTPNSNLAELDSKKIKQ